MTEKRLRQVALFTSVIRFLLGWLVFGVRVRGLEHIPQEGAVLACNHRSLADGPLLWMKMRRPMIFMATRGVFKIPVLGQIISWMGFVKVYRGDRVTATSGATTITRFGDAVRMRLLGAMYTEGGISTPEHPRSQKSGVHRLYEQGLPVLAVVTHGAARILPNQGWTKYFPRFWRRVAIEVHPPFPPGLSRAELLGELDKLYAGT